MIIKKYINGRPVTTDNKTSVPSKHVRPLKVSPPPTQPPQQPTQQPTPIKKGCGCGKK